MQTILWRFFKQSQAARLWSYPGSSSVAGQVTAACREPIVPTPLQSRDARQLRQ
jgi:hypothetical protein